MVEVKKRGQGEPGDGLLSSAIDDGFRAAVGAGPGPEASAEVAAHIDPGCLQHACVNRAGEDRDHSG